MRKRRHNRTAGFSLIEVVVGIALLGLVTAPVCASLILSVRLNSHAQALMSARLQASGVVETLLAEGITTDAEGRLEGFSPKESAWEKIEDGVTVVAEKENTSDPFYKVTVSSSVGVEGKQETVVIETRVRAVSAKGGEGA